MSLVICLLYKPKRSALQIRDKYMLALQLAQLPLLISASSARVKFKEVGRGRYVGPQSHVLVIGKVRNHNVRFRSWWQPIEMQQTSIYSYVAFVSDILTMLHQTWPRGFLVSAVMRLKWHLTRRQSSVLRETADDRRRLAAASPLSVRARRVLALCSNAELR